MADIKFVYQIVPLPFKDPQNFLYASLCLAEDKGFYIGKSGAGTGGIGKRDFCTDSENPAPENRNLTCRSRTAWIEIHTITIWKQAGLSNAPAFSISVSIFCSSEQQPKHLSKNSISALKL